MLSREPDVSQAYPPFCYGSGSVRRSFAHLLPSVSQSQLLWQTYLENVDPFFKILHPPTVSKLIQQSMGKFSFLGDTRVEALLFALCLAAVTTFSEEDVSLAGLRPLLTSRLTIRDPG